MKAWDKSLFHEDTCKITKFLRSHDKGFVRGAFNRITDRTIAKWLKSKQLMAAFTSGLPVAVAAVRISSRTEPIKDFTGAVRARIQPGDVVIKRIACSPKFEGRLCEFVERLRLENKRVWLNIWEEHPIDKKLVTRLGARWIASNVLAGSELVGIWLLGKGVVVQESHHFELVALCRLKQRRLRVTRALHAILRRSPGFTDHYSKYNKARSWSAFSLRGYGGRTNVIIKPAAMSRRWRMNNCDKLDWPLVDTPARKLLPEVEPLVRAVPGKKHRIRIMRLAAGGVIERHADIVDRDAGITPGKLLRIHVPLRSNSQVWVTVWDVHGRRIRAQMHTGEVWYLDQRKPHAVVNTGATERIHLVMDTESCPELLQLLRRGHILPLSQRAS